MFDSADVVSVQIGKLRQLLLRETESTGLWRKRVGVEPTIRPAKGRIADFEGREGHRTPFASGSDYRGDARRVQSLAMLRRRGLKNEFPELFLCLKRAEACDFVEKAGSGLIFLE